MEFYSPHGQFATGMLSDVTLEVDGTRAVNGGSISFVLFADRKLSDLFHLPKALWLVLYT